MNKFSPQAASVSEEDKILKRAEERRELNKAKTQNAAQFSKGIPVPEGCNFGDLTLSQRREYFSNKHFDVLPANMTMKVTEGEAEYV